MTGSPGNLSGGLLNLLRQIHLVCRGFIARGLLRLLGHSFLHLHGLLGIRCFSICRLLCHLLSLFCRFLCSSFCGLRSLSLFRSTRFSYGLFGCLGCLIKLIGCIRERLRHLLHFLVDLFTLGFCSFSPFLGSLLK